MDIQLKTGDGYQDLYIPDDNLLDVLLPANVMPIDDKNERQIINDALDAPYGSKKLEELVKPGDKIAVITSDNTRPFPSKRVLPVIIELLEKKGILCEDIIVVIALGSHRSLSEEEKCSLIGEAIYEKVICINSGEHGFCHAGVTSRGTSVDIDSCVFSADVIICLGNIEYHYFAGFSGGAKAILPGVASKEAIRTNHSFMVSERAVAGCFEGNPVREDIEEAASMVGVDYILNVVLDSKKKIIAAFAGDVIEAHREGCRFLSKLFSVPIKRKADIVIASQGGAPKDINLYQTQKALDNAKYAVNDSGIIILVGSCKEGFGESVFAEWLTRAKSSDELINNIKSNFILGGHKAAAIAMVRKKAEVFLVSDMDDVIVPSVFFKPYKSVQDAFDDALKILGKGAQTIVMPYAGSTLPVFSL